MGELEAVTRVALCRLAVRVTWLFALIGAGALMAGALERGSALRCLSVAVTGCGCAALVQLCSQRENKSASGVATAVAAVGQAAAVAAATVRTDWPAGGLLVANGAAAVGAALALMVRPALGLLSCALSCAAGFLGAGPGADLVLGATPGALLATSVAVVFTVIVIRGVQSTERELAAVELATAGEAVAQQRWQARRHLDRTLHDTVLVTLSLLAQPELAVANAALRERCRQDLHGLHRGFLDSEPHRTADPAPGDEAESVPLAGVDDIDLDCATAALVSGLTVNRHGDGWREAFDGVTERRRQAAAQAVGEALRNVVRHAHTDAVDLVVLRDDQVVVLQVVDQGAGFEPAMLDLPERRNRLGLRRSISDRIEDVGGWVSLTSCPGNGTSVTLVLPLAGDSHGREQR